MLADEVDQEEIKFRARRMFEGTRLLHKPYFVFTDNKKQPSAVGLRDGRVISVEAYRFFRGRV